MIRANAHRFGMRPQIVEAIDRLRSALADSPAFNWETLIDETGLSTEYIAPDAATLARE